MRILILEHEPDTPPALLGEWAQERAHEQVVVAVTQLKQWPDPRAYDAVVSLGSDSSVHAEPHRWVPAELDLLAAAHAHDVPVLGICFGGQALAKALGGHVGLAPQPEARWGEIETAVPDLIMPGPWFCWHADEFGLPSGSQLLAGSPRQTMAFASKRSLALQYHPEVDAPLATAWIEGGRAKLADQGISTSQLRAQIERHAVGARDRAFEQFDRIAAWWNRSRTGSSAATDPLR